MIDAPTARRILRAYRSGLLQPASPAGTQRSFGFLLRTAVSDRIALTERLVLHRIWRSSGKGLTAAEHGRLEEASDSFRQARDLLSSSVSTFECRLLAGSVLEAAEAYLEYKNRDFSQARARIHASMNMDRRLELSYGYDLLRIHRLQSAHNLVRIALKEGMFDQASFLAGGLLAYLSGARGLAASPRHLLLSLADQVVQDIATALERAPAAPCWKLFRHSCRLEPPRPGHTVPSPRVREWIHLKDTFLAGNHEGYLRKVPLFLGNGISGIPVLWYSSLLDVVEICESRAPVRGAARYLRDSILRDLLNRPGIPPGLLPRLERCRHAA